MLLIAKNLKYAKYFSTLFKQKKITNFILLYVKEVPKNNNSQVKLNIKNKKLKIENTITNYKLLNKKNNISSNFI